MMEEQLRMQRQQLMELERSRTLQQQQQQQGRQHDQMLWLFKKPDALLRSHSSLRIARQHFRLTSKVTLEKADGAEAAIGPMIAAGSSLRFRLHVLDCDVGELSLKVSVREICDAWYSTGGGICLWSPRMLHIREDPEIHGEAALVEAQGRLEPVAQSLQQGDVAEVHIDLASCRLRSGKEEIGLLPAEEVMGDSVPVVELGFLSDAKFVTVLFEDGWATTLLQASRAKSSQMV